MTTRRSLVAALGAAGMMPGSWVHAQDAHGMSPHEILIGRATPASSPFGGMALQRRTGAYACIAAVNAAGGIHGRKIRLVDRDDAYEANKVLG